MRNSRHRPRGRILVLSATLLSLTLFSSAQTTFPVNGVADAREHCYAFTHATLVKDGATTVNDATLIIRDGLIVSAGAGAAIPKDAVVIDCSGKYIYPSFIDLYTDYGIPSAEAQGGRSARALSPADFFRQPAQIESATKGAFNWN